MLVALCRTTYLLSQKGQQPSHARLRCAKTLRIRVRCTRALLISEQADAHSWLRFCVFCSHCTAQVPQTVQKTPLSKLISSALGCGHVPPCITLNRVHPMGTSAGCSVTMAFHSVPSSLRQQFAQLFASPGAVASESNVLTFFPLKSTWHPRFHSPRGPKTTACTLFDQVPFLSAVNHVATFSSA